MSTSKDEDRYLVAAHEIGHVLLLKKIGVHIKKVTVNHKYGCTQPTGKKEPEANPGQIMYMAGPAAEALMLHELYRGEFPALSATLSKVISARSSKHDRAGFAEMAGSLSTRSAADKALSYIKSNRGSFNKLTHELARKGRLTSWDL